MNSGLHVEPHALRFSEKNATGIIQGMDVVIDCLDNFESRYVLNETCVKTGVPFIHGGVRGLRGEVTTILPGKTPCLRCLFPDSSGAKEVIPVFGVTASATASFQAMEAIKLISGFGRLLTGRILYIHGKEMEFYTVEFRRRTDCVTCGT
jgi:adenylyltransferase/sulfurtransferase